MLTLSQEILKKLKERGIFSEYLPNSFCMNQNDYNIYNAGGSHKDAIEPYSYTMSRLGKPGDRRTISIPEPSGYVSVISFLKDNESILDDIVALSVGDECSFSRIVNSDSEIVDDDGGYGGAVHHLAISDSGDKSQQEEKQRSIFIDNMLYKIDITKGACGILHIDISEFYRSIYTHAITVIKLGVEGAMDAFINNANDEDYKKYKNLDIRIHNLNGKRTNGLLTGPYLSKVISEAILARVDEDLKACNLVFTRYADDYEFAVYDKNEVNKIKAIVADIFDKYFFRINNEKTRYEEYPFYTFSNFEKMLGTTENEKADIEIVELFNRFWALEKKGEKGAVRYLLKVYQDKYRVQDEYVYTNYLITLKS